MPRVKPIVDEISVNLLIPSWWFSTPWLSQNNTVGSYYCSQRYRATLNSSWPSATYMRRDFQCLFPQRPRYGALITVLISPVPHTWGVTNGSLLASPPNSRRSPASLISPAPHICGASRTPILLSSFYRTFTFLSKLLGTHRTPHALHHTHTQIAA